MKMGFRAINVLALCAILMPTGSIQAEDDVRFQGHRSADVLNEAKNLFRDAIHNIYDAQPSAWDQVLASNYGHEFSAFDDQVNCSIRSSRLVKNYYTSSGPKKAWFHRVECSGFISEDRHPLAQGTLLFVIVRSEQIIDLQSYDIEFFLDGDKYVSLDKDLTDKLKRTFFNLRFGTLEKRISRLAGSGREYDFIAECGEGDINGRNTVSQHGLCRAGYYDVRQKYNEPIAAVDFQVRNIKVGKDDIPIITRLQNMEY